MWPAAEREQARIALERARRCQQLAHEIAENAAGMTRNPQAAQCAAYGHARLFRQRCDLSTSHFDLDLDGMLTRFAGDIISAGTSQNIDARAIAGAIAWEYEENLHGRYSDYLQYNDSAYELDPDLRFGDGLGQHPHRRGPRGTADGIKLRAAVRPHGGGVGNLYDRRHHGRLCPRLSRPQRRHLDRRPAGSAGPFL